MSIGTVLIIAGVGVGGFLAYNHMSRSSAFGGVASTANPGGVGGGSSNLDKVQQGVNIAGNAWGLFTNIYSWANNDSTSPTASPSSNPTSVYNLPEFRL